VTGRRRPRWSEFRPYLSRRGVTGGPLERAGSIGDMRALARRRVPRAVFDYVDGAAEDEVSLQRSRQAFAGVQFAPRVLRDVSQVDLGTTLLGRASRLPVVLAPTGLTRLLHHQGEVAVVRAARDRGIPYALSTMGTSTPEQVAQAAPEATRWFQLYLARDRELAEQLVHRAAAAGYHALVLTVDTAAAGARLRDRRNGFSLPPALTARTLADLAVHPRWWFNLLTTGAPTVASTGPGTPFAEVVTALLDPAVGPDELRRLRSIWPGPLVVKGVQSVDDARLSFDLGADAVVLSNHGGRQLDRSRTPLELLPQVRAAVGPAPTLYLDSGVLGGADVVAALALGADGVLVGRAYLYGLMAGGEAGVRRVVDILEEDMLRTMRLLGVTSVAELSTDLVRLEGR
jgi:L-lactate dehydrogenase (cytochrome)